MKIRIHNPCNEHTRYFRYYNFFWDKFTDFLKTKFEVEENRYFENAHSERFKVFLEKGDEDGMLMLECEYIIENLENGEFVILSVADDLYGCALPEQNNPHLKKVLLSQYISEQIVNHTHNNSHKYQPWTYFQCVLDNLEFYKTTREFIPQKIQKLYFRGDERNRPILEHINTDILENPNRSDAKSYFDEVINYEIGLSVGGVGNMCYRDVEYMALGIPFIRFEYNSQLNPPLIPNYHYISIPMDEDIPSIYGLQYDRLGGKGHAEKIEQKFKEVINDKEYLAFISKNARKYYEDNLTLENLIKNTYFLLELNKWL